jgi:hypothetical protein
MSIELLRSINGAVTPRHNRDNFTPPTAHPFAKPLLRNRREKTTEKTKSVGLFKISVPLDPF